MDDEFLAVKLLSGYVNQTEGLELVLGTTNATEMLNAIQTGNIDLVLLDVQMPGITGIEILEIIRNTKTKAILTTAYSIYAIEGYEYDIVDYLLKPIIYGRFLLAVNKAKERLRATSDYKSEAAGFIFVKTEYRLQKVQLCDILYLEGLRDYIAFYTTKGKILSLERLKNMDEILPAASFLRIHKSYIINVEHIDYVTKGRIVINKEYLPVGETYKECVGLKLGL